MSLNRGLLAAALFSVLPSAALADERAVPGTTYSHEDARRGAQLRAEAAIVIPMIFDPCGSSSAMDDTNTRYARFSDRLSLPRQSTDLAIARADYDYRMSLVDIQCLVQNAPEFLAREKLNILVANSVLDRMEALIQPQSE